jgi:hypothetical protein
MMMKRIMYAVTVSISICIALAGCSSDGKEKKSVAITGVDWATENISTEYWSAAPSSGFTAWYDFWIDFSGNFDVADVEYARIYTPDSGYWTIASQSDTDWIMIANGWIGGYGRWPYRSTDPYMLPIGNFKAEIKLTNGSISTYDFIVHEPGSASYGGANTTIHTEDLTVVPAFSAPMLRRAALGIISKDGASSTIHAQFSVADTMAYYAEISFYSDDGRFVGRSPYLRDPVTGLIRDDILGVGGMNVSGEINNISLPNSLITYKAGMSFSSIYSAVMFLYDGAQFTPQTNGGFTWSCRSISSPKVF